MFARKRICIVAVVILLLSAAAFADSPLQASGPSPQMLEGLSPEAVMDLANDWGMKYDENQVRIWTTSREFHFEFPDGAKSVIPMPADRMVVSIAPYIRETHPCKDHFPSSCRGEQTDTSVTLRAVSTDGTVVLEEKTRTLPNGFVDLWLPRGLAIDVTIETQGLTVTQRVGTSDADKTCITEAKLHP